MQRTAISLACFFICVNSFAQQYPFVNYTPKDGLVNNRARDIFQDSKGKLYIATFGGLSVYDGSKFTNYTTDNGLVVNLVNDIVEMGDDSLWIIPNANRIHCMVNGKLKDLKTQDDFYPVINQLLKCSDGFYYALADEGLFRFEKNRFIKIPLAGLTDPNAGRYLGLAVEMDGKLFVIYDKSSVTTSSGALLVYDLYAKQIFAYQNKFYCFYIIRTPQNELWVSTINGVYKIDKKSIAEKKIDFIVLPELRTIPKDIIPNMMYVDRQKNIWLTSHKGVLKIDPEGSNNFYTQENGLPYNIQTSILQDRENNMWFTNEQTGFAKLPATELEFFAELKPGFTPTDLYIHPATDSVWLFDGYHNSSLIVSENKIEEFQITGTPLSNLSRIAAGKKKFILKGPDIFEWKTKPGKSSSNLSLLHHDSANSKGYTSAIIDRSGNLIASSNNLVVITGNKVLTAPLNYYADQVAIDKENRIWIATRSRKIFCFDIIDSNNNTSIRLLNSWFEGLPAISPRSITADNNGNIWIGTRDHGLFCFLFVDDSLKSWKQITTRNGLSENFVSYLYCDPDNTIWACTPAGLDKIIGKEDRIFVENITRSNNIYQNIVKIQATRNGVHWVLTQKGIIRINPQNFLINPIQPELLFTQITAGNDQKTFSKNKLTLSYLQNNLSIHIAAPSFIDEKQTRFSYFLEGGGITNWSEPSSNTEINFANLPPGKYTLKAKAIFLNGLYPDAASSFSFLITPPWWQTWWFRMIAGLLIIGFLITGFRFYFSRKLEKEKAVLEKQQAVEKERTRIASDMHDDLGAGLSSIRFLGEKVKRNTFSDVTKNDIEKMQITSNELMEKMNEIIWAMSEKNDSLEDLLSYTRSYAKEYCEENELDCSIHLPENIPALFVRGEIRRNIFLTVKESLHNIVKHAAAGKVVIDMIVNTDLEIMIRDDGKGFSMQQSKSTGGNGMRNMKKRITSIGGTLDIDYGQGVTIKMKVPLVPSKK